VTARKSPRRPAKGSKPKRAKPELTLPLCNRCDALLVDAATIASKQPTRAARALAFAAACGFDFRRSRDPYQLFLDYMRALGQVGANPAQPSNAEQWAAVKQVAKMHELSTSRVLELLHEARRGGGLRPSRVPQKGRRE
jgi:hypothetical protein